MRSEMNGLAVQTNILIIDDGTLLREVISASLREKYCITQAADFSTALYFLYSGLHVDMVILDLAVSKREAFSFMNELRTNDEYKDISFIAVLEHESEEDERKALENGADRILVKPYHAYNICKRIELFVTRNIRSSSIMKQTLASLQERFDSLREIIPGAVCVFQTDSTIRMAECDERLEELSGYTRDELLDFDISRIYDYIHEEDCGTLLQMLYNEKLNGCMECTVRLRCKDGGYRCVVVMAKRIRAGGSPSELLQAVLLPVPDGEQDVALLRDTVKMLQRKIDTDRLTGIYTRERFCEKTAELLRSDMYTQYVMIVFDVDHFRVINELYGSKNGDHVLINIARMLALSTRGHGTWGRLQADRFCVCVGENELMSNIILLERFLSGDNDINVGDTPVKLHAGIYRVTDTDMPVGLMCDRAAVAVRSIKNNYVKRWINYDSRLNYILEEQELVNDMQAALDNREFFVMYQPIVDSATKKIVSAEALVRWQHPVRGLISPGVFIPLFEHNGFITNLDYYVCEEVCRFLAWQQEQGLEMVPISVNLSRMNFYSSSLCSNISSMVREYGVNPAYLKLEITESAYQSNQNELLHAVRDFKDSGFRVMMDDFGSGYSSLNMLKDVMVDVLKIDMKFMDNLEESQRASNILYSIVQMAKSLDIEIVVEGVETKVQYQLVRNMGCDCIQGYYFYRPLMREQFIEYLSRNADSADGGRAGAQRGLHVLIVDEEEKDRKAVRAALNDGYRFTELDNGGDALDYIKLHSNDINLVIAAIDLSGVSGIDIVSEMQHYRHLKSIPVVMLTSRAKREQLHQALECGALDVVTTPFEPALFRRCTENILKIANNDSIRQEVYKLRERVSLNQEILSIVSKQNIGMCRIRLAEIGDSLNAETLKIEKLMFTTEWYEYVHKLSDDNRSSISTISDLLDNMLAAQKALLCRWFRKMLAARTESGQYMYEMILNDMPARILLSIRVQYENDTAVLDIIEELYNVPNL